MLKYLFEIHFISRIIIFKKYYKTKKHQQHKTNIMSISINKSIIFALTFLAFINRSYSQSFDCATNNPCQNGGICYNSGSSVSCICLASFTGTYCQTSMNLLNIKINSKQVKIKYLKKGLCCNSSPCQNGGTCNPIPSGGYFCSCSSSYLGTNCEIGIFEAG